MKSLIRALELVKVFKDDSECLRLVDIVERTGIHKASAHRLLAALVTGGLLVKVDSTKYRLGMRSLNRKRYRIGFGMQSNEFSFSKAVADSLQRAAFAANIELLALDNEDMNGKAIHNAEVFIREGVDLVIESHTDSRHANEISEMFHAASIPVIALEIPQPRAVFYGANNVQAGLMAGRHLARWSEAHWKGIIDELLLLELPKAGHIPNARVLGSMLGVIERLAWMSQGQIKVLHSSGHYENALGLTRRHLLRSKSKRILVAAINDPCALGALQAFRDLGREEQCAIVGQNASVEARQEIAAAESRLIGSVGYFPERYGEVLIPMVIQILSGGRVAKMTFVKHEMITKHNLESFYPQEEEPLEEI